jgi:hypothetical protein
MNRERKKEEERKKELNRRKGRKIKGRNENEKL